MRLLYRYLTAGLDQPESSFRGHNAHWKSWIIYHTFLKMGYQVDALNWKDNVGRFKRKYDVVFDIVDLAELKGAFKPETIKIFMLTGSDNVGRNMKGLNRVKDLNERRGCGLKYYRYIHDPTKAYKSIELADHVLLTGNEVSKHTYPIQYWDKINLINVTAANAWGLI